MKAKKTRNELKISDLETYPVKERRTEENLHGFAYRNLSEALRKHVCFDFLHGNNFFHPNLLKYITSGIRDP